MIYVILSLSNEAVNCYDCLDKDGYKTHFWCTSTKQCLTLDKIGDCKNAESHDLVLNASRCCSDINKREECISHQNINFCTWCPNIDENQNQDSGLCLYRSDVQNIQRNCHGYLDLVSPCSSYKSCKDCLNDLPCIWCATRNACITRMFDSNYGFSDPFGCKEHQMTYDKIIDKCVCLGEAYFDDGKCVQCPPNIQATKLKDSCNCGALKRFNKQTKQCECEANSIPDGEICVQCPEGALATEETCICENQNEKFNKLTGACECVFSEGFGIVDGICVKCQKDEVGSQNGCTCLESKSCGKSNVLEDKEYTLSTIGLFTLGAIAVIVVVVVVVKQRR